MVSNPSVKENETFILSMQECASRVLDALIPNEAEIILLDYPNNTNVGDSLIWLGEIAYLKKRNLTIRYCSDVKNYNPAAIRKCLTNQTMILLSGGGNFGTLWQEIQAFRLRVLKDFQQVPIIQLPQSLHFSDQTSIDEINKAMQLHGQFKLLVRSHQCYEYAIKHLAAETYLCPDMAFFIGKIRPSKSAIVDRLIMARTDHEATGFDLASAFHNHPELSVAINDWLNPSWIERMIYRVEMHTRGLRQHFDSNNLALLRLWNFLACCRLQRGVSLLTQGKCVVTDRLHVHILSILLGLPNVILDNNYGKIKYFYQTWTMRFAYSLIASQPGQVSVLAKKVLDDFNRDEHGVRA